MKMECLRLIATARAGDHRARCAVAEHYLHGTGGFPKHLRLGVEYLDHPNIRSTQEANLLVARSLSLTELLDMDCLPRLRMAASLSDSSSLLKLAVWQALTETQGESVWPLLQRACQQKSPHAEMALNAWATGSGKDRSLRLLSALASSGLIGDASNVALRAANQSLASRDVDKAMHAFYCAAALVPSPDEKSARTLCGVFMLAKELNLDCKSRLDVGYIRRALELLSAEGESCATFILGRAYCHLPWGAVPCDAIVPEVNLRKGTALLLRAADKGHSEAWIDLHRLHSNSRSSVGNPNVAAFCLEKAATHGDRVAQRRLGAMTLRDATSIRGLEQGISLLHSANLQGDIYAKRMLESLVFPMDTDKDAAEEGLRLLRSKSPWLAARLRVARHFGLTRQEALSFCPISGARPWGLVVDKNPFLTQAHVCGPRAVPAISDEARRSLSEAISFFSSGSDQDRDAREALLKQRSLELRRTLRRHCIDGELYFAVVSSSISQTMKSGAKWAYRHRQLLADALDWNS